MSDDTDAFTEQDVVDLMLSSEDNLPVLNDIMFVYPFVGGQAIENAAKGLLLFHDSYCTPTMLMHLQEQACQPKRTSVAISEQDQARLLTEVG
jgi:hypothetical protein